MKKSGAGKFLCSLFLLGAAFLRAQDAPAPAEKPLFSFAVFTDVQYADKDTAGARDFRGALDKLRVCVTNINARLPLFAVQLGDLIDGYPEKDPSIRDLNRVLDEVDKITIPVHHVVGNHCLTAGRERLPRCPGPRQAYYDYLNAHTPGWRFAFLDGTDAGYGVVSTQQLAWLQRSLRNADELRDRVIVFSHFALAEGAAARNRMSKPQPVLDLLERSGRVVAVFAGHDHAGGYVFTNGIHHVTVRGLIENAPGTCAIVSVYPDRLVETGFGSEPSRVLRLK